MTAPTAAADPQAAQAAQEALLVDLASTVRGAVAALDLKDLRSSIPSLGTLIAALTNRYGAAVATLAATHYSAARSSAGVASKFTVIPADAPSLEAVGKVVNWATRGLWSANPALAQAERNLVAGAEKLILDTSRATVINNVQRDRKAISWARVTETKPCYFCALLATRGAVYRSQTSADFRSHDHCRCAATPNFDAYVLPQHVQEWRQLYQDSTTGGNAKRTRAQWRKAFQDAYGD